MNTRIHTAASILFALAMSSSALPARAQDDDAVIGAFERLLNHQAGYYAFNTNLSNPAQYWFGHDHDAVHTAGVKADWEVIAHKLKLGVNYTLSHGRSDLQVQATPFTAFARATPLPVVRAITNSAGLRADYSLRENITLRGGYDYGRQPIPKSEVMMNILAPGVMEQHATLGATRSFGRTALSLAVTRAFSKSVEGANALEAPGQQTIKLEMQQWDVDLGLSYGL